MHVAKEFWMKIADKQERCWGGFINTFKADWLGLFFANSVYQESIVIGLVYKRGSNPFELRFCIHSTRCLLLSDIINWYGRNLFASTIFKTKMSLNMQPISTQYLLFSFHYVVWVRIRIAIYRYFNFKRRDSTYLWT